MSVRNQRLKKLLLAAQDNLCPWCDGPILNGLYRVAADHIIPKCFGGPDDAWNRQALHEQCNRKKSRKLTDQAIVLAAEHGIELQRARTRGRANRTLQRQYLDELQRV